MTTKVMVSFTDEFLREVDRVASQEHRSRSELVREAIRLYIQMRPNLRKPGDLSHVRRAIATQDAFAGLDPGTGQDSSVEVRKWREARK